MNESVFIILFAVFAFFLVVAMHVGYVVGHKFAARLVLRRVRQLCLGQEQVRLSDLILILKEEAGEK